uniref:Uncharacterized protein n=1 Tax=Anopheles atroparvus TaxID=41427 RepID=A0AAG5D776_ANOAO
MRVQILLQPLDTVEKGKRLGMVFLVSRSHHRSDRCGQSVMKMKPKRKRHAAAVAAKRRPRHGIRPRE